jgi:vacuolar protein sorting-associated protein 41
MRLAVDFIERHEDVQQAELWNDLVDYSIKNPQYLSGLLEYLGICNLNAVSVVSSIPAGTKIPGLRQKILRVIRQYHFQVAMLDNRSR